MAVGLVPLAAVAVHGRRLPSAWWWLGGAFGVSFLADLAGRFGYGNVASQTYPVLQAGLFAFVLAPRDVAKWTVAALAAISSTSLWLRGGMGLDVVLHIAAFGSTAFFAYRYLSGGTLRATLALGFGALVYAWGALTLWPTFLAWGVLHTVRLATAVGFALAAHEATQPRTTNGV